MTAKEARDNFTDLIEMVYYGKEPVIVEKKGRPFAVVISPDEYERYKEIAKEQFFKLLDGIHEKMPQISESEANQDIEQAIHSVRKAK